MPIAISCEPARQAGNLGLKEDWFCNCALISNMELVITGLSNLRMNMQANMCPRLATHSSVDVS